jgi:DNA-binding MarR family transcriptional regulator
MVRQGVQDPGSAAARTAAAEQLADVVPRLYRLLRTALDEDPTAPSLEQLRVMQRIDEGLHHTSALAAARQMRMSAITSILDVLVERNWARREPDSTDRRRTNVELTPVGRTVLARGRRLTSRRMRTIVDEFPGRPTVLSGAVGGLAQAVTRYDDHLGARRAAI